MDVILEPISTENTGEEIALTSADDPPPPAPLTRAQTVLPSKSEAHPEQDVPVKRPRGRPKGKAKAKPPAPRAAPARAKCPSSSSSDSSTDDEPRGRQGSTSAAVRTLMEDDMETQVLQFLTARKASQQTKRHELWARLAESGLRR